MVGVSHRNPTNLAKFIESNSINFGGAASFVSRKNSTYNFTAFTGCKQLFIGRDSVSQ